MLEPIQREFLGWDTPALQNAARRIVQRFRRGAILDLKRLIVVVPGQRAGRRLQELLAFAAEDNGLLLTPPAVVTEGGLPELLYTPKQLFAGELAQDMAWAQALRELPLGQRQHVLPHPPAADELVRWLALGKLLRAVHSELAADGLDFTAVQTRGPQIAGFHEEQRWQALVALQRRYLAILDELKLWDIQTARLRAIEYREIQTDCEIILLGTVDLNNTQRQMLDQVAEQVTAFVVAPESFATRFDSHGCLVPGEWCHAEVPLRDDQLCQADGRDEQADAVTDWLARLDRRFRVDEVTVGVPDESLVLQLQRQLEQSGVEAHWVEGARVAETAPFRLLAAAVQFASNRRYEDLASLVRHADLEKWLMSATGSVPSARSLPAQLDEYYNTHLPSRVPVGAIQPNERYWPDLAAALKHIDGWLANASGKDLLGAWAEVFRKILGDVYGSLELVLDEPVDAALHKAILGILGVCDQLHSLPEALDTVPLTAGDAFRIALGPLADEHLPPPAGPDAIEILGWLELPLDDSKALVVTSFNEGFVAKSSTSDPFLPDRLRRELGLLHNERRYARDAYATSVICHSRQELHIVFARRDTKGEPLQPSRLVFACSDDALIARATRFFGERKAPAALRRLLLAPDGRIPDVSEFKLPPHDKPGTKLERISVTRFKSYLACPYRYYLRHVKKLEAVDDSARELDGASFGNLIHKVLSAFGRDSAGQRNIESEEDIFDFLSEQLRELAKKVYGAGQHRPAIRLQLEQARRRLQRFSSLQAELVRTGWRIVYAERDAEEDNKHELAVPFPAGSEPLTLVGRIDRIDFNESQRTLRVLDYKTADEAKTPNQSHRKADKWIDLQLPLYRHLRHAVNLDVPSDCTVELGYFNLPKSLDEVGVVTAGWDDALLAGADELARDVIRKLRDEVFGPITYPAPKFCEDLAAICLDNVMNRPPLDDGVQGGAA
jgi:RecB family exonuclease